MSNPDVPRMPDSLDDSDTPEPPQLFGSLRPRSWEGLWRDENNERRAQSDAEYRQLVWDYQERERQYLEDIGESDPREWVERMNTPTSPPEVAPPAVKRKFGNWLLRKK